MLEARVSSSLYCKNNCSTPRLCDTCLMRARVMAIYGDINVCLYGWFHTYSITWAFDQSTYGTKQAGEPVHHTTQHSTGQLKVQNKWRIQNERGYPNISHDHKFRVSLLAKLPWGFLGKEGWLLGNGLNLVVNLSLVLSQSKTTYIWTLEPLHVGLDGIPMLPPWFRLLGPVLIDSSGNCNCSSEIHIPTTNNAGFSCSKSFFFKRRPKD